MSKENKTEDPGSNIPEDANKVDTTLLRFEHLDLHQTYSVMELATLAASCRGRTLDERFKEAIRLLIYAENLAQTDKWEQERQSRIQLGDTEGASKAGLEMAKRCQIEHEQNIAKAEKFCRTAKRENDEENGLILVKEFVTELVNNARPVDIESEEAMRKYNMWLGEMAVTRSKEMTRENMDSESGPGNWNTNRQEVLQLFGNKKSTKKELAEFKARFQRGQRLVFHSHLIAKWLAVEYLNWRATCEDSRHVPRRSRKTKRIVSRSDSGAGRGENGRFGKK